MTRPVAAVLIDFGHTLFDNDTSVEFLAREAAALGAADAAEELAVLFADALVRSRTPEEMAKGRDLGPDRHRACWTALWSELDVRCPGIAERLYEHEISPAGWHPYADVQPVLESLRARGVPLAVVSDTGWDIRPVFAHHDLARFFDAFVLSYEVGVTKPAPAMFEQACAALGVEPGEALMVGDNHRSDGGAVEVGCRVLLLPPVPSGSSRGLHAVLSLVRAESDGAPVAGAS